MTIKIVPTDQENLTPPNGFYYLYDPAEPLTLAEYLVYLKPLYKQIQKEKNTDHLVYMYNFSEPLRKAMVKADLFTLANLSWLGNKTH